MGAKFQNLYIKKEQLSAVDTLLTQPVRLWQGHPEWAVAVAEGYAAAALEKAAKKAAGPVLLFDYFDDDYYVLSLYSAGKKLACIGNMIKSKGLKQLAAVFPEGQRMKKLGMLPRCVDMQEQITLMEETLGLPLYTLRGADELSSVHRADTVYDALCRREKELKTRPNEYVLTQLEEQDWPASVSLKMQALRAAQEKAPDVHLSELETSLAHPSAYCVPGKPGLMMCPAYYHGNRCTFLYEQEKNQLRLFMTQGKIHEALWLTEEEDVVGLAFGEGGLVQHMLNCHDKDGREKWSFRPSLSLHQHLQVQRVTEEGKIYLLAGPYEREDISAFVCCVDGENGQVLAKEELGSDLGTASLRYLPDMGMYAYCAYTDGALVLLDADFRQVKRIMPETEHWPRMIWFACGNKAYSLVVGKNGQNCILETDVMTGKQRLIIPELPVTICGALSDGTLWGANEAGSEAALFDEMGKVISRFRLKGQAGMSIFTEQGQDYLLSMRKQDACAFWSSDALDGIQIHRMERKAE